MNQNALLEEFYCEFRSEVFSPWLKQNNASFIDEISKEIFILSLSLCWNQHLSLYKMETSYIKTHNLHTWRIILRLSVYPYACYVYDYGTISLIMLFIHHQNGLCLAESLSAECVPVPQHFHSFRHLTGPASVAVPLMTSLSESSAGDVSRNHQTSGLGHGTGHRAAAPTEPPTVCCAQPGTLLAGFNNGQHHGAFKRSVQTRN